MKFFNNCKTLEEVKKLYKKLALEHHPDKGGNTETMQTINTEYAFICAKLLKGENLTDEQINEEMNLSEELRQAIEQIIHLPGITIEVVGYYIWVTGNTYPVRNELKSAKFVYHGTKECWYYANAKFKVRGGKKTLEEIKAKYGSATVHKFKTSKEIN